MGEHAAFGRMRRFHVAYAGWGTWIRTVPGRQRARSVSFAIQARRHSRHSTGTRCIARVAVPFVAAAPVDVGFLCNFDSYSTAVAAGWNAGGSAAAARGEQCRLAHKRRGFSPPAGGGETVTARGRGVCILCCRTQGSGPGRLQQGVPSRGRARDAPVRMRSYGRTVAFDSGSAEFFAAKWVGESNPECGFKCPGNDFRRPGRLRRIGRSDGKHPAIVRSA